MRAPPVPTIAEMAESCAHNARIAKGHIDHAIALRNAAGPPGTDSDHPNPEWEKRNCVVSKHQAEFLHWSNYAAYYRGRVAREGGGVVPIVLRPIPGGRIEAVAPPDPGHDSRLPRERDAGDDDVDEAIR